MQRFPHPDRPWKALPGPLGPWRPLAALAVALPLASPGGAQSAGSADLTPTPPPTAAIPLLSDVAPATGVGTDFDDLGTGRGLALVDVVGPDPSDPSNPALVGPPDGILDVVQTNSNSPGLPYGAGAGAWVVPPIGTSHHDCRVWRGVGDGTYQDVAAAMSPNDPTGWNLLNPGGSPWGVIAGDIEGDGDDDLFYICGGFNTVSQNALMRNEGDGTFTNVSTASGVVATQATFGASFFDHDLDGDLDLYVANGGKMFDVYWSGPDAANPADRLLINDGLGGFADGAPAAECNLSSMSFSVATGDLDRNGWTDIAVSCFKQWNKVFYGDAGGVYSLMAPATNATYSYAIQDLVQDPLYPGKDFPSVDPLHLDVLPLLGEWSMPIQLADFNGDGWLDIVSACWSNQLADADDTSAVGALFNPFERSHLYLNRGDQDSDGVGDGEFREVGAEVGYDHIGGAMGFMVADYNGDGLPDIYVGGGGPDFAQHFEEDYLYVNEPSAWPADWLADPDQPLGQALFEVGALAGTYANNEMSHGVATIQRPGGGGVDLIIGNGGPAAFDAGQANIWWRNTGNDDLMPYAVTEVDLTPTVSAPGANGARVELIRDGLGGPGHVLMQERSAGFAFASHDAGPLVFGREQDGLLFSQVRWPSGVHQGRMHWFFDPQPSSIDYTEITTSISLRAVYSAGGGMTLESELLETGAAPWVGHLYFATLVPLAPNVYTLGALIPAALGVTLQPGTPLNLSAPLNSPAPGVYALALIDPFTLDVVNAAGVWHEPAFLQPTPVAASWTPPGLSGSGALPGQADGAPAVPKPERRVGRRFVPVRRGLRARAAKVEVAEARAPIVWHELTPARVNTALPAGDRLRFQDGVLEAAVEGPFEGTLDLAGEAPILTLGAASGCCELVDRAGTATLVRITGLDELVVDEHPVTLRPGKTLQPAAMLRPATR